MTSIILQERQTHRNLWSMDEPDRRRAFARRAARGAHAQRLAVLADPNPLLPLPVEGEKRFPLPRSPQVPADFAEAHSNWRQITNAVLARRGMTLEQIQTGGRGIKTVRVVGELCYRLRRFGRYSGRQITFFEIGAIVGRHYSTCIKAAEKFAHDRGYDA